MNIPDFRLLQRNWDIRSLQFLHRLNTKVPFPPAWGGQPEEILREKSGLALKFCHPSRFLVTAETKEDAIEACRRALRAAGRPVSAQ